VRAALSRHLPFVAILRGVTPEEVVAVGDALVAAGFGVLEVPLNSPRALESVGRLAAAYRDGVLIGAGTVLRPDDVDAVAAAGGRLIVMPHGDAAVLRAARARGLRCMPGVLTPTEAFAALAAGADALKLFPGELVTPAVVRALRAVLPRDAMLLPTGGVTPASLAAYVAAGATGFGLGTGVFRPGDDATRVAEKARAFADAWARLAVERAR
jgi:2-dehydro-3-deoxyphosphogalactonate aldolase